MEPNVEQVAGLVHGMPDWEFTLRSEINKTIVTIKPTGDVEIGEGVTLTEAARAFWYAVQEVARSWQQVADPDGPGPDCDYFRCGARMIEITAVSDTMRTWLCSKCSRRIQRARSSSSLPTDVQEQIMDVTT